MEFGGFYGIVRKWKTLAEWKAQVKNTCANGEVVGEEHQQRRKNTWGMLCISGKTVPTWTGKKIYLYVKEFMPVISLFQGLIIYMFYLDNKQHKLPHIHVKYNDLDAVYSIPDGILLEGSLPSAKEKLVLAWIELRKEDLMADWQLAVAGQAIFKIDPLK
jgi:Domain of unknown function (DUF4160)